MGSVIREIFTICVLTDVILCVSNGQTASRVPEPGEVTDMCELDPYTLQCEQEQVIQITLALYGRMTTNQCTTSHDLGCTSDALGVADSWCSGRQKCYIDESFHTHLDSKYHDCSRDSRKYLQISFKCVDVITPPSTRCSSSGMPAATLHNEQGYLSSCVTRKYMCYNSPWIIRAPADHVIRIQIIDFTWFLDNPPCDVKYIEVFDFDAKTTTSLCRLNERRHDPMDFTTSALQIQFLSTQEGMEFLVHYMVFQKGSGKFGALAGSGSCVLLSQPGCLVLILISVALVTLTV